MADSGKTRPDPRSGEREGAVTSTMVARAANVSQSTVSLVLSGKSAGRVSAATRTLVEETARQLGYRPNVSAQTLRTGIVKTLAFAVPDLQQPFFGQVLYAAELFACRHGYNIILIDTLADADWAGRLLQMFNSHTIAGCIVYASDKETERRLAPMQNNVVYIEADDEALSGIDLNTAGVMKAVAEHLAALGHRRIGYLAARYPRALFQRRFDSFVQQLALVGIAFTPQRRQFSRFGVEEATACALQLLENDVTAVVCDDDLLAGALYRAARKMGKSIPGDLSVIGFNDVEIARLLSPELTTIAIPAEEIGQRSVELLLAQLGPSHVRAKPAILDLHLRLRGSTGPAAK